MSLKSSPKAKPQKVHKIAVYLGLGLGLSGELIGSAWIGWWVGTWWARQGGSKQTPGLAAAALVVLALGHVIWLLLRMSNQDNGAPPEEGIE